MNVEQARSLIDAFTETVRAAEGLKADGLDAAIVEAGRTLCVTIDDVLETGTALERTKALYLMPHLVNILREMEATPKARSEAKVVPPAVTGGAKSGTAGRRARAAQRRSQAAEQA